MDRLADLAQPDLRALHHRGYILHADGRAVHRLNQRVPNIVHTGKQSDRANIDLLLSLLNKTAARVDVVCNQLLLNLRNRQSVRHQLLGIETHLILACYATKARHIDHTHHGLELLFERPVFKRFKRHIVVGRIRARQRVPVDLSDRAPVGPDLRLQTRRKRDTL